MRHKKGDPKAVIILLLVLLFPVRRQFSFVDQELGEDNKKVIPVLEALHACLVFFSVLSSCLTTCFTSQKVVQLQE